MPRSFFDFERLTVRKMMGVTTDYAWQAICAGLHCILCKNQAQTKEKNHEKNLTDHRASRYAHAFIV